MTTDLAAPCIRLTGSEWTTCRCDPCRTDQAKKAKKRRNGISIVEDQRDAAWKRLTTWEARGYTGGSIAALVGLSEPATRKILRTLRQGKTIRLKHETARRIMAAPDRPVDGKGWIPSAGTWRRLRALTAMGYSMALISERTGILEGSLSALRDPKHSMTRPHFAQSVRKVYDELSMTPGPSRFASQYAARKGWHGPLAWDDDTIDDPNATPDLGEETPRPGGSGMPIEVLVENIEWLLRHDSAMTTSQLAARLGYVDKSGIQNALTRHGHRDILDRLKRNAEMAA